SDVCSYDLIRRIEFYQKDLEIAEYGHSFFFKQKTAYEISRGDFIVSADRPPFAERTFAANISWFENKPLDTNQVYLLQNQTKVTKIKIPEVHYRFDINTQEKVYGEDIRLNDIGRVTVKAAEEVVFDLHKDFPTNARGIIIDPRNNLTVGALTVEELI